MDAWSAFHRASSDDAAEDFADNPTLLPRGPLIYRKRPRSADKRLWSLYFFAATLESWHWEKGKSGEQHDQRAGYNCGKP